MAELHAICRECDNEAECPLGGDLPRQCPHCGSETVLREGLVHGWFGLTYAQYLTVPRSIMEAMPHEWQERMVACLEQLDGRFNWRPEEGRYWCRLKDDQGRFADDPLMEYRRPDRGYIASLRRAAAAAAQEVADA